MVPTFALWRDSFGNISGDGYFSSRYSIMGIYKDNTRHILYMSIIHVFPLHISPDTFFFLKIYRYIIYTSMPLFLRFENLMKVGSPILLTMTYVKNAKIRSSLKFLITQDLFLQPQEVNVVLFM